MTHSRARHQIGAARVAQLLLDAAQRNSQKVLDPVHQVGIVVALLLHDIGHRAYSHELEQWLEHAGVRFHHEALTIEVLTRKKSRLRKVLKGLEKQYPELAGLHEVVVGYLRGDSVLPLVNLVSGGMDADRLHYVFNDTYYGLLSREDQTEEQMEKFVQESRSLAQKVIDGATIYESEGRLRLGFFQETAEPLLGVLCKLGELYDDYIFAEPRRGHSLVYRELIARALELYKDASKKKNRERKRGLRALFGSHQWFAALIEWAPTTSPMRRKHYLEMTDVALDRLIQHWTRHQDPVLSGLARMILQRSAEMTHLCSAEMTHL